MTEEIRNIGLIGHGGSGKTSIAEAMLFDAGSTTRMGRVDDGNTAMDFEPEELKRQASISTGFHQCSWKKHTIHVMDTPGDQNFFADTRTCLQGADSCLVAVDAVDGVKVQTEQAWDLAAELNLPCIIFINRLDRERSDFSRTVEDTANTFNPKPIVLQLPIGSETEFSGIVDLLNNKAFTYGDDGKAKEIPIPDDMAEQVEEEREALIENVAEADDDLLERYLEGEEISDEDIKKTLRAGTISRAFVPVFCGSATQNVGIDLLMDNIIACLPCPSDMPPRIGTDYKTGDEVECAPDESAPFSGLVIKTMAGSSGRLTLFRVFSGKMTSDSVFFNSIKETKERIGPLLSILGRDQKSVAEAGPGAIVAVAKLKETTTGDTVCDDSAKVIFKAIEAPNPLISYAVVPTSKGDEDKIFSSLRKLLEEDAALRLDRNQETKEILLSGMGQVHIEITVDKMKRKFNVGVGLNTPKVPYRETIKKKIRVQGRHKKQTGGNGQFGDCFVVFEPKPRGEGFEFVDAIVGGVIPKTYIPAVEKGIIESAVKGVLAGFPTVDFRATLDYGSYHSVDSSEIAFKLAGSQAFKKAIPDAGPTLLEPIMKVTVTCPDDVTGDIMGDMNSRRGRVLGMDSKGKYQVVEANVPMSEFLTYAPDLNSMTAGRGLYTMEFSHYEEVPTQLQGKIIEAAAAEKE